MPRSELDSAADADTAAAGDDPSQSSSDAAAPATLRDSASDLRCIRRGADDDDVKDMRSSAPTTRLPSGAKPPDANVRSSAPTTRLPSGAKPLPPPPPPIRVDVDVARVYRELFENEVPSELLRPRPRAGETETETAAPRTDPERTRARTEADAPPLPATRCRRRLERVSR